MKEFDLEYIQKRRIELGLTMQEMAKKLGMSNASSYCKYEKGEYKLNAEMIPKLAIALKTDIKKFFTK